MSRIGRRARRGGHEVGSPKANSVDPRDSSTVGSVEPHGLRKVPGDVRRNELPLTECLACELADGRRPLPGGRIHASKHWLVEHCVGPLGLGTLIVKPKRHVTGVADLAEDESADLGPLLRQASRIAGDLVEAQQVYNCLWSHAGGVPVHIHYVIQPVTAEQMTRYRTHGPALQVAMFESEQLPDAHDVERIASLARAAFSA